MVFTSSKSKVSLSLVLLSTLALSGCGSLQLKVPFLGEDEVIQEEPKGPSEMDFVLQEIRDSAKQIQASVDQMSSIKQADIKMSSVTKRPTHPDLNKRLDVSWPGAADDLVKVIANKIHWSFDIVGDTPSNRPEVYIHAENEKVYDILKQIGLQVGSQTGVIIDPKHRRIVVSYEGK
jgi:hypothetical protein